MSSREFRYEIPEPKFNKGTGNNTKAMAILLFRKKSDAVSFSKRFVGANYSAAYIGGRGIVRVDLDGYPVEGLKLKKNEGYAFEIRIEYNKPSDLQRAVGFIECQLMDTEDSSMIPLSFEVWKC